MKQEVLVGQTDYTVLVLIRDDAGAPATGLTEASIDIAYARVETDNDVTTSDVTPAALASLTAAHTDWGFEEVSATDHPGLYRLDIADAVFASGAWSAVVSIVGTGLDPCQIEFVLVNHNPQSAIADILTDTAEIGAAGAGLTNINLPNQTMDIVGNITGNLSGSVGSVTGAVGSVTAMTTANVIQISGDSGAADTLETWLDDTAGAIPWLGIIDQGTAQSASATTLVLRAATPFGSDDAINGATVWAFGSDQGYWQARVATDYTTADDTVTVPTWDVTPSGTITYKIFGTAPATSSAGGATAQEVWEYATRELTALDEDNTTIDLNGTTIGTVTAVTTVNGLAANVITAAATAADFGTEIGTAVWASADRQLTALDEDATTIDLNATTIGTVTNLTNKGDGSGFTAIPWNAAWDAEVESEVDDALGSGNGSALTSIPWNAAWDAEVQSEVQDALDAAVSEPGQGNPAANASIATSVKFLYKAWRNRSTQTADTYSLYADDATTVDQDATVSDNGTTLDRGEVGTGA